MENQLNLTDLQSEVGISGGKFNLASGNIGGLISIILEYIFGAAGIVLLLILITGGIQFMTSGGDPKATQAAKQRITNAIIGIIIMFVSFWIVQIIGSLLGVSVFGNLFSGTSSTLPSRPR